MALTAVSSAALDLAVGLHGDQISVVLVDLRLVRPGRRSDEPSIDVPLQYAQQAPVPVSTAARESTAPTQRRRVLRRF